MKRKIGKAASILFTWFIMFLPCCNNKEPVQEVSEKEITKEFALVTDDKLDSMFKLELAAGDSYQIHTTVDSKLGNKYKLVYGKGLEMYPYGISKNGLITTSGPDDPYFSTYEEYFHDSITVSLWNKDTNKELTSKMMFLDCIKIDPNAYANITLTDPNLTFDSETKTYTLNIVGGEEYTIQKEIDSNTEYYFRMDRTQSTDIYYYDYTQTKITTFPMSRNVECTVELRTTKASNFQRLDTVYLRLLILETPPQE